MTLLLAHSGAHAGDDYSLAVSILALVGMIVPFIVLGVVVWIFWKAKKREDAAELEMRWRSARSS